MPPKRAKRKDATAAEKTAESSASAANKAREAKSKTQQQRITASFGAAAASTSSGFKHDYLQLMGCGL
jgi:hypothetical protein